MHAQLGSAVNTNNFNFHGSWLVGFLEDLRQTETVLLLVTDIRVGCACIIR